MRRFLLVLALLLAVLLLVGGVAGHVVLRSDLPRRIVERELAEALGLEVRLDALRIGWTGRSEARGVRIGLPLDDKPLLEAPRLELGHTAVLAMVTGFELRSARVVEPSVYVREAIDGQWNLDQARQIVGRRLAQREPRPGPPAPLALPALDIVNAHLVIERYDMPEQRFDQVAIRGRARGPMAYELVLDAEPLGQARASFAGVAPFMHEASFDLQPSSRLLHALLGDAPDARMIGRWRGRYDGDRLRGTLELTELTGPGLHVAGSARVTAAGEPPQLTLEPIRLDVALAGQTLRVSRGRLAVHDRSLRLDALGASLPGGWAQLDGQLALDELTGQVAATWDGIAMPAPLRHGGRVEATISRHGPVMRRVQATAHLEGVADDAPLRGVVELTATGTGLDELVATVDARELRFAVEGSDYRLDGARAHLRVDGARVELTHLTAQDPAHDMLVTGRGQLDRAAGTWAGRLDARHLALPGLPAPIQTLELRVSGDDRQAVLEEARVVALRTQATAEGAYRFDDGEQPLALRVRIEQLALPAAVAALAIDEHEAVVRARRIAGEASLTGTLRPLELSAEANVVARDLVVHRDALGDVELRLYAHADADEARFHADAIEWLDGQWHLSGRFNRHTGRGLLGLEAEDIDLTLVEGVLGQPLGLTLGRADLAVSARGLAGQREATRVDGRFVLRDLERAPLRVEALQGELELADGWLHVDEIEARQQDGRLTGRVSLALATPTRPRLDLSLEDWPIELAGGLAGRVGAHAQLEIDVAARRGSGELGAEAELTRDGLELGQAELALALQEQVVHLTQLRGQTLEGSLAGSGRIDLDTPLASELHLTWSDLRPAALGELSPHLARTQGAFSGELRLRRSVVDRPLGLMQLDVELTGEDLMYGTLRIGGDEPPAFKARAFFDFQRPDDAPAPLMGLSRVVLDEASLKAIDGELSLWARAVRRAGPSPGTGQWFGHLDAAVDDIDLEMLTRGLGPEADPTIGRLSAQMNLSVPLDFDRRPVPDEAPELAQLLAALPVDHQRWGDAFGRGSMSLRASDLAAVPLFSRFYDYMNLRLVGRQAEGQGEGRFRVDEGMLVFERFSYHNRGLQISLAGRVEDLWAGGDSELSGFALLSFQPLPDVEFIDVLGEALTALQAGLTAVEFYNTVGDPRIRPAPARGLGRAVRSIITGSPEAD